jgi:hypothetical protein
MAKLNEEESNSYIKQLQQEAARAEVEKQAVIAEFEELCKEQWDSEKIRDKFKELLPDAFLQVSLMMKDPDINESTKVSLIKFVVQISMTTTDLSSDEKEKQAVSRLLAELTGNAVSK